MQIEARRLTADGLASAQGLYRYIVHTLAVPPSVTEDDVDHWANRKLNVKFGLERSVGDEEEEDASSNAAGSDAHLLEEPAQDERSGVTWEDLVGALRSFNELESTPADEKPSAAFDAMTRAQQWRLRAGLALGLAQSSHRMASYGLVTGIPRAAIPIDEIPALVIRHESPAYRLFHRAFLAVTVWDALIAPIELCFVNRAAHQPGLRVVTILCDVFYLIRIIVRFRVSVINASSVTLFKPKDIMIQYLSGDFPLDIFASWPHNFLADLVGAPVWVYFLLRLLRLVNLHYVRTAVIGWRKTRSDDDLRSGLVLYIGVLMYTAHLTSCVWNLCAFSPVAAEAQMTWWELLHTFERNVGADSAREDASFASQYLMCLFFSMSMITSLGLAQIPANTFELVFYICVMVLNMTVYAWTVGQISALVMKQDDEIVAKRAQLETVQAYIGHIRVPVDMKQQIEKFFHARLKDASLSSIQADQVYEMLPMSLQLEVSTHTVRPLVEGCSLLSECSSGFKDRFASLLKERRIEPETIVFRIGEVCSELLVVKAGSIDMSGNKIGAADDDDEEAEQEVDSRGPGTIVGGMAFTFGLRHFRNGVSGDGSETVVYALSREAYKTLIKTYPKEEGVIMDKAMNSYMHVYDDGGASSKYSTASALKKKALKTEVATRRLSISRRKSLGSGSDAGANDDDDVRSQSSGPAKPSSETDTFEKVVISAREKRDELQHGRLCAACFKGDAAAAKEIITTCAVDVNRKDSSGRCAVHLAACGGHLEVIKLLANSNADVNVEDNMGGTPLSDALRYDHNATAEWLYHQGAVRGSDIHVEDLCEAAARYSAAGLASICRYGMEVNVVDFDKRTALHVAAAEGNVDNCKLLIENSAHVNSKDRWGSTPLQDALRSKRDACCELLMTSGALLGMFDEGHEMCKAAAEDDVEQLERLLKFGCDLNVRDSLGRTPLHVAAANVKISACHFLLGREGVQVNATDNFGHTPLDDAKREETGKHPIVQSLIAEHGGESGSGIENTHELKEVVEEVQLESDAKDIESYASMLQQTEEMVEYMDKCLLDLHYFQVSTEEAIKLESRYGAVLTEEMPELWTEVRTFADQQQAQRDFILETVYPNVKRWVFEIHAQDIIGESLRVLQVKMGELVDQQRSVRGLVERLAETQYRQPKNANNEDEDETAESRLRTIAMRSKI